MKEGFNVRPGSAPLNYDAARSKLWGTVRMETPVLYFYTDTSIQVDVRVDFPRGLITESYPVPSMMQLDINENSLRDPDASGFIEWKNVEVSPHFSEPFPMTSGASHYYAARNTDATPLRMNGQSEKFLVLSRSRGVRCSDRDHRTRGRRSPHPKSEQSRGAPERDPVRESPGTNRLPCEWNPGYGSYASRANPRRVAVGTPHGARNDSDVLGADVPGGGGNGGDPARLLVRRRHACLLPDVEARRRGRFFRCGSRRQRRQRSGCSSAEWR